MLPDQPTPCAGKWALFDSLSVDDHHVAKELCATCPAIQECNQMLEELLAQLGVYAHPEGTWAGRFLRDPRRTYKSSDDVQRIKNQRAFEDRVFDDTERRRAHAAYVQGDRSDWARMGHRAYDRHRKQEWRRRKLAS